MPLTDLQIGRLVEKYLREQDRYEKMASTVHRLLQQQLRENAIHALVTFRAKDERSFRGKLLRERNRIEYSDVEQEFFPRLLDLAGARVLLYRPEDVDPTCALIERMFLVPAESRYRKDHNAPNGYRARHRVATLREEVLRNELRNLTGVHCEIQVTTIIDHIWNEPEHDIRYKSATGAPSAEQGAFLRSLRSQLNSVVDTVTGLTEATTEEIARKEQPLEAADELRRALETMHARALSGDFSRLFDILTKTHRSITRALLEAIALKRADFDAARAELDHVAVADPQPIDDVAVFFVALWADYGPDIVEIVPSWTEPPPPLTRLIELLQRGRADA
jgi:ppGpp synthetase/RelA/SpoT-type nucleotidyltranferase